ncbi:MAG: hypothetical protein R3C45_10040 [Phycisphaerales bacterium]
MTVRSFRFLPLLILALIGIATQNIFAADPWITTLTGVQQNQTVAGTLHVETHVTNLDGYADYDLRYQIDGPSGFIYTARELPFKLNGDIGWDTSKAIPGKYTLHAFLIRNHRCIAFRIVDFNIVRGDADIQVTGIVDNQVLTTPTQIRALFSGVDKPTSVTFDLYGPRTVSNTERYDPYTFLGDNATWDTADYPHGAYILNVTARFNDKTSSRPILFYIGEGPDTGTPETPSNPETPETPETPDVPTVPDIPTTPDRGETGPLPDTYTRGFLGINLAEVTYYDREWAFVDAMKLAREWLPTKTGGGTFDTGESLKLDTNGWPILQSGQAAHTLIFVDTDGAYPAGKYVCTFEGEGDVVLSHDAKQISRSGNRIVANVDPSSNGIDLRIENSNPNNPVRNVKLWMPGFENAESPFHPLYLERLKPFSVIRFMDWMRTNGSSISSWSDRPKPDYYTQGTRRGVALEYMIELCNELGADPWFCMPHLADDAYVYAFARQVRMRLRPDLNVYVEWSNEVWNSQFPQHKWVQAVTSSDSLSEPFRQRWAQEANRDFDIWREVFAEESDRVIRLAVGQKDNPWVTQKLAEALNGRFDAISCSTYFGFTSSQRGLLNASIAAGDILDMAMSEMTRSLRRNYQAHGDLAREWTQKLNRNIPLIGYEGGQHYTADGGSPPWARAILDVQKHPRMYDAYIANMREWRNAGGSLFTAFNFVEKPDKWGAWGQLDFMDQNLDTAPKYRALIEFVP